MLQQKASVCGMRLSWIHVGNIVSTTLTYQAAALLRGLGVLGLSGSFSFALALPIKSVAIIRKITEYSD